MVDNDSIFRSHCVKLGLGIYGFSLKTNAAIKEENILTSFMCLLRIKRLIWIEYLECHYSYYLILMYLFLDCLMMVEDDFLSKRTSSLKAKEYLLRWWNTLQQFYVFDTRHIQGITFKYSIEIYFWTKEVTLLESHIMWAHAYAFICMCLRNMRSFTLVVISCTKFGRISSFVLQISKGINIYTENIIRNFNKDKRTKYSIS